MNFEQPGEQQYFRLRVSSSSLCASHLFTMSMVKNGWTVFMAIGSRQQRLHYTTSKVAIPSRNLSRRRIGPSNLSRLLMTSRPKPFLRLTGR